MRPFHACFSFQDYNFYRLKNKNIKKQMEFNKQFSTKICHSQQQNIQNLKNVQTNTSHNHSCENFKNQNFVNSQEQVRLNKKKTNCINQSQNLSIKIQNNLQNQGSLQQRCVIPVDNIISLNQRSKIQQQNDEQRKNEKLQIFLNDRDQLEKKQFSNRSKIQIKSTNYKIQDQNIVIKLTNSQQKNLSKDSIIQQKYLAPSNSYNSPQKSKIQQALNKQRHRMIQSSFNKSNNFTSPINQKEIHFSEVDYKFNGDSQINNGQCDKNNCQSLKIVSMPKGFMYLLQILNLSYVLPQVFQIDNDILSKTIKLVEQYSHQYRRPVIQEYKNSYNTFNSNIQNIINFGEKLNLLLQDHLFKFIKNVVSLMIQDLTSQKLQLMEKSSSYNMVCLAKFTKQNQLFQFIFKYNWPLIVLQIVNISQDESVLNGESSQQKKGLRMKQQFFESLHFLQNSIQCHNYNISQNIEISLQIISLLIDSFSRTNLFRQFFNKKIQINRITSKKKNQLQQEKKNLQQILKKLNSQKNKKTKKINKNNKKQKNNEQKDQQSQDFSLLEKIQSIQKQVENIMILIEQQNNQQNLLSCCLYLGKDRNNFIYWFVKHFSSMIFVEKGKNSWFLLQFQQIPQFLKILDNTNYNEIKLYERLNQQYTKYLQRVQKCKMSMDLEQNCKQNLVQQIQKSKIQNQLQFDQTSTNKKIQIQVDKILQQNQLYHNEQSHSSLDSYNQLVNGLFQFKIDKNSLYKMIQAGQRKMTEYLKERNSKWGNETAKQILLNTIKGQSSSWLQDVKKQLSIFNQKICVVEIQYKVYVQQSSQQVDSKIKKIQTKIWGINQKYKHNWYDFIGNCNNFYQLFYGVCILYSLIKKYTSKNRKLRKQYEQIKQKTTYLKTQRKKQWIKDSWNEQCQVCGLSGQVLCCDFCPKVYHLQCINLMLVPVQQFKCKACTEQVTTRNQLKNLTDNKKNKNK